MEIIIKEIVTGKFEYDTVVCENGLQIVVKRGTAKEFVGKKVKYENGVFTEITEPVKEPVKTQQTVKKFVK